MLGVGTQDADQFEFIEFLNIGTNPADLANATFDMGITYTFPATTLAPGARLILVRNAAAFSARYPSVSIFGTYGGGVSNSCERLLFLGSGGQVILDIDYLADATWPAETDGDGYSLTLKNPATSASSLSTNWRVSTAKNGSPSSSDALNPASYATILDYALDTKPTAAIESSFATFTWRQRIGADAATITPQLSTDLATWTGALVPLSKLVNLDGTRTIRLRSATAPGVKEFFRLHVVVP